MTDTKSSVQRAMANSPCSVKMNKFKDVRVIGKGQHGTVYQACLNDACKKRFAVKVSNENLTAEHNLTKKFIKMVGKNSAANVYALEKCKSNTRLYSEFLNGQPLKKLLPMLKKDPEKIKPIVHQVLKILKTLHEKNPSFRHNDLHLENIFITTDGKVRIIDFGLSFNTVTKNPEVNINGAYLMPYGIFRGNNKMYDVHFFLNSLLNERSYLDDDTLKFILDMLPVKYQGDTSTRVHYYRLKPSLNNHVGQGLPTFTKLFNHSYIKGKRLDSMLTAISKPRTVSKPVSTSVQKRKTPPSTETMSAKRRAAAAVLMKSKGTPKKRPGATSKKPPTIPVKSSSKSPNNTETLANLQKRLLTKTRAKPSSIGKVSPTFVKEFMKNMARPKTNLRNRNI
jgi:tRNA A-37 threonylcarbamoyl transferase component Bud32